MPERDQITEIALYVRSYFWVTIKYKYHEFRSVYISFTSCLMDLKEHKQTNKLSVVKKVVI